MALGTLEYNNARQEAVNLKNSADAMDGYFNDLRREMNSLSEVLRSKGADELTTAWLELERKLDGFPNKIRGFSDFLNSAVDQYQSDDADFMSEIG